MKIIIFGSLLMGSETKRKLLVLGFEWCFSCGGEHENGYMGFVAAASASAALHRHEKLAIAVSKAMRGHSLQETKNDGRFHVHTKTYLDGVSLKEVGSACFSLC